jgi:hypothetical protein
MTPQIFVEQYVMVDSQGRATDLKSEAITHGYLDLMWRETAQTARFRDWKSGRWEYWNEFESHAYALATRAFFPGVTRVVAELCFLRTGHIIRTEYEWQDDNTMCLVTKNDGSQEQLWSETDPILDYIIVRIDNVLTTKLHAKPGPHCSNWYGRPCQFFGKECPLNHKDLIQRNLPEMVETPEFAKALADVIKGCDLTPSLASNGLYAIQQMEHFLEEAKERIKEYSKNHGPILIGDSKYGWQKTIKHDVDIPYVINVLLDNEVPIDEWSRLVSISKTSISKLPKRQFGEVRELLEAFAITPSEGKPRFAEIKNKKDGE